MEAYGIVWNHVHIWRTPVQCIHRTSLYPHPAFFVSHNICLCDIFVTIQWYTSIYTCWLFIDMNVSMNHMHKHIPISRIHPICCVSFCKTWNQCFFLCLIIEHFIFFSCIHIPWSLLWHYRCWLLTICGCHKCYLHNGPLTYKPTSHGNMWHLRI